MADPDHYQALGVDRGATASEIRTAFKTAARRWHPDKNLDYQEEATAKFKSITCAYDVLSDERKRCEYDRKISERARQHWSHQNGYPTSPSSGYQHSYVYGMPQTPMHWTYPGQATCQSTISCTMRHVNGMTITSETKVENGVATVREYVDGILTSETVQVQAFGGFGF